MAGTNFFMGDERAAKSVYIPVDFEEYVNNLRAKAEGITALDSPWFWAVIRKRANGVSAIPRRVMRGGGEGEPDALPFRIDFAELLYRGRMALDVFGAAHHAGVPNRRRVPIEGRWLDPRENKRP